MSVYEIKNKETIAPLFEGWGEALIWSCLQGCMGEAYADDLQNPQSAQIISKDFCFLAGVPNHELIGKRPGGRSPSFIIMVPQHRQWEERIELVLQGHAARRTRYATRKDSPMFDNAKLRQIVSGLPAEYELKLMGEAEYRQATVLPWAKDLCGSYSCYEDYRANGLGVAVLKEGEIVAGASSYAHYIGGIEIEIDTRADQRRRGLAAACGAALVLECLKRGLYPSWDAQNKHSLALAEKLGYVFDKEYPVYEVLGW